MTLPTNIILSASLLATASLVFAHPSSQHFIIELGGYITDSGEKQDIDIVSLEGNTYTVDSGIQGSVIVGLGYYFNGFNHEKYEILYGVNAFYLFNTQVSGNIFQEHIFENLSYNYDISHLPIYVAAKGIINPRDQYAVTLDVGIGPNFIFTSDYDEHSLDGMTIPDHSFTGDTNTVFSAMAGIGVKINHVFGNNPMECGYRFFYLGNGELEKNNSQIENSLSTGTNYANALFCSVMI